LDTKASEEATNCIVSNNRITHCDTSCIFDTTVAKNSVITGNYAALSGPAGAGPNYVDLNIYVPIVIWKPYLSSVAPATPSSLDNISIEN
jgi:hypothetical protein